LKKAQIGEKRQSGGGAREILHQILPLPRVGNLIREQRAGVHGDDDQDLRRWIRQCARGWTCADALSRAWSCACDWICNMISSS